MILSVAAIVPKAEALPQSEIYRVDYERTRTGSATRSSAAADRFVDLHARSGWWMEVESMNCETGAWVQVSSVGARCP